jgi:hypothetical protein
MPFTAISDRNVSTIVADAVSSLIAEAHGFGAVYTTHFVKFRLRHGANFAVRSPNCYPHISSAALSNAATGPTA